MKNKTSFTLVEILVSIAIFTIVILFLHQALDMTQKTNSFYSEKLDEKKLQNNLKKMFFLDLIHKNKGFISKEDRQKNSIVTFQTTNTYHNPFYQNITYMVSKEKNLIRIESKTKFNSRKLNNNFFNTSYIDIIDSNITKFKVKEQKDKKIVFYILKENDKILYSF